jgi:hypothetical protein
MQLTQTLDGAWSHAKRVFFPVNAGTWFSFGLIFFLQSCAEEGGSGSWNQLGKLGDLGKQGDSASTNGLFASQMSGLTAAHSDASSTAAVAGIVVALCAVMVPVVIAFMWLGSRGQAMAIQAVASGAAPDIGQRWSSSGVLAGRLLRFKLLATALYLVACVPAGVGMFLDFDDDLKFGPSLFIGFGISVLLGLPISIMSALVRNFVAPVSEKMNVPLASAWRTLVVILASRLEVFLDRSAFAWPTACSLPCSAWCLAL